MSDVELAAAVAEEAGALLLALRAGGEAHGKALGALGDRRSDDLIAARLRTARPEDPDPLRGVRRRPRAPRRRPRVDRGPALRHARVRVARSSRLGGARRALAARARDHGRRRRAARARRRLYPRPRRRRPRGPLTAARSCVSDSRPPEWVPAVAEALGARVQPMGSAGAKAMAVVRGEARRLCPRRRTWEVGLRRAGRRRARARPARLAHRRRAARVQRRAPVPPGPPSSAAPSSPPSCSPHFPSQQFARRAGPLRPACRRTRSRPPRAARRPR